MSIKTKLKIAILLLLIAGGALFVWIYNQEGFTGSRIANPDAYSLDIERMNGTDRHTLKLTTGDTLQIPYETQKGSLYTADWSDITVSGLDENSFVKKLDTEVLQNIAAKLQSLVEEELAEERENQEIILSEGFTRVFKKELYLEVIDMGNKAEMPLYYILYKSPNNDMYEYICAVALSELTGLDFMNESGDYYDWSSGKEYLELFNEYMLQNHH